ncbi:DUF1501 domain-containing protein [uncultured Jatrophihabitans sp.]|uniref:DUF1501 domain-containing protein n=1 Tax=uncultured Jatrophihabitans sp. TaxID=1610747 RepID=UPI0035C97417
MTSEDILIRRAEQVNGELQAQDDAWGKRGWTRRRFLAGAGMAGVAAFGTQLVTTRAAYAATPSGTDQTLVVVFLRGAADGLRVLVPASSGAGYDYLKSVRPALLPAAGDLIQLSSDFGLNKAMKPLYDGLWSTNELTFVPAVSAAGFSRSHFQAQQFMEKGGSDTASSGWLQRVLPSLGSGSTFRAVTDGSPTPAALVGDLSSLAIDGIDNYKFPMDGDFGASAQTALLSLYRGVAGPLGEDVPATMSSLKTAAAIRSTAATGVVYPNGNFGDALKDLARILRAEVGMQVATVDVGGWDTHTDEVNDLDNNLSGTATALRAFMDDLGPDRRKRVTVVVMTEFGRRVAMNGDGGTDHGHGSVMWLLGGGLKSSTVGGDWKSLSDSTLDQGDVPGVNSPFDVLGELVQKRLGVGSLSDVFPGHSYSSLGLATT